MSFIDKKIYDANHIGLLKAAIGVRLFDEYHDRLETNEQLLDYSLFIIESQQREIKNLRKKLTLNAKR
nr:MAG TPA: hypothetical protein [Caudoviricetes sp.]